METRVSSLGQGPGLAWKRGSSSFPPGSLAELQDWTGGKTEPPWHGEVDFQQWNTIGWGVTDDGVLCIRPWEGSAGETGPARDDVPWNDQSSKIKKVESTGTIVLNEDSQNLFYDCSDLTDLAGIADWDVSNAMNMFGVFSKCSSLTDLTALAHWNVSNVENMSAMFYDCSSLTDLTGLKNWNVSNVTNMNGMFDSCYSLQKIGIPSIANGGQNLVENAESSGIADAMPSIISEDESMGPLRWDELKDEMTSNPDAFQEGTVWLNEVR